jgi:rod shape-determining protein MreD
MLRPAISVGCGFLLWLIAAQANHYLALWHVSLFVGGLMVAFPALRLSYREGAWVSFILGLFLDAGSPVPFGLHAFLLLLAHGIVFNARSRFPREENIVGLLVAVCANLGIFLAISIAFMVRGRLPMSVWPRLFLDCLASQVVIALITPWFFALQEHALEIGGVGLRRDQRGLQ